MIITAIIVVIVLAVLISCGKVVPQNHKGLITVMGKCVNANHPLEAGFHLKMPFVESIISVSEEQQNIPLSDNTISVTTSDQALAYVSADLTFHVVDPYAYTWGNANATEGMRQKVQAMLRDIIGGMKLTDALKSNEAIQSNLQKRIDKATDMYGLHVDQVNIEKLQASSEMQQHMDEQKQSRIDQTSKQNEANGDAAKIKTVNDAQNKATVNTASANATATEKAADAKKYAIKANADAQQYTVGAMKKVLAEVGDDPKLAAAYFNYLSIHASAKMANAGNMVFTSGKLNNFGQVSKMAVMQHVWNDAQNDESRQSAAPSSAEEPNLDNDMSNLNDNDNKDN